MKGRPLLPTLRTKKRYVVYELIAKKSFSHGRIYRAIQESYGKYFGLLELGKAGLMDAGIHWKDRGVLKVNHKYLVHLRASLALIKEIDGEPVALQTRRVSGILKKVKRDEYATTATSDDGLR